MQLVFQLIGCCIYHFAHTQSILNSCDMLGEESTSSPSQQDGTANESQLRTEPSQETQQLLTTINDMQKKYEQERQEGQKYFDFREKMHQDRQEERQKYEREERQKYEQERQKERQKEQQKYEKLLERMHQETKESLIRIERGQKLQQQKKQTQPNVVSSSYAQVHENNEMNQRIRTLDVTKFNDKERTQAEKAFSELKLGQVGNTENHLQTCLETFFKSKPHVVHEDIRIVDTHGSTTIGKLKPDFCGVGNSIQKVDGYNVVFTIELKKSDTVLIAGQPLGQVEVSHENILKKYQPHRNFVQSLLMTKDCVCLVISHAHNEGVSTSDRVCIHHRTDAHTIQSDEGLKILHDFLKASPTQHGFRKLQVKTSDGCEIHTTENIGRGRNCVAFQGEIQGDTYKDHDRDVVVKVYQNKTSELEKNMLENLATKKIPNVPKVVYSSSSSEGMQSKTDDQTQTNLNSSMTSSSSSSKRGMGETRNEQPKGQLSPSMFGKRDTRNVIDTLQKTSTTYSILVVQPVGEPFFHSLLPNLSDRIRMTREHMRQIVDVLKKVHDKNIYHNDCRFSNFFYTKKNHDQALLNDWEGACEEGEIVSSMAPPLLCLREMKASKANDLTIFARSVFLMIHQAYLDVPPMKDSTFDTIEAFWSRVSSKFSATWGEIFQHAKDVNYDEFKAVLGNELDFTSAEYMSLPVREMHGNSPTEEIKDKSNANAVNIAETMGAMNMNFCLVQVLPPPLWDQKNGNGNGKERAKIKKKYLFSFFSLFLFNCVLDFIVRFGSEQFQSLEGRTMHLEPS
eukprot:m.132226 g.132226  ORF g.132226 m.132226 type:complete len:794 (-) comp13085_c0_seq14:2222-4603(-)